MADLETFRASTAELWAARGQNWDRFRRRFLCSRRIVDLYTTFLQTHLPPLARWAARDFLALYIVAFFDIIAETDTNLLVGRAARLLTDLHEGPWAADRFVADLAAFKPLYAAWKSGDREDTLSALSRMYWEYELNYELHSPNMSQEDRDFWAEEKTARQRECIEAMERIDGLAHFRQYTPVHVDTQASAAVLGVLREAFWDRVKADVRAGEWASLMAVFAELSQLVGGMMRRRAGARETFQEAFDVADLSARAAAGALDETSWSSRCGLLMETLIELDSAAREESHRAFWREAQAGAGDPVDRWVGVLAYAMTRLLDVRAAYDSVMSTPDRT